MRGLPKDALSRTDPDTRDEEWTVTTELLAQIVEEVSVVASNKQRSQPREIPRPAYMARHTKPEVPRVSTNPDDANVLDMGGYRKAMNLLKNTRKPG